MLLLLKNKPTEATRGRSGGTELILELADAPLYLEWFA